MGRYGTVRKRRFYDGVERLVWEKRVPRIPDEIRNSIISLYPSVKAAEDQAPEEGASGFITSVVDEAGSTYLYAVTNRHVVQRGARIIRIAATKQILDMNLSDWHFDDAAPDVAVCFLDVDSPLIQPIGRGHFASVNPSLYMLYIGIGDDVFMVGRFHPAEAEGIHDPIVRFGNIATWPSRRIEHPVTKLPEESFLVEMRSQSGCSGSPVFVIVEPGSPRPADILDLESLPSRFKNVKGTGFSVYKTIDERRVGFLGLDWGHLPHNGGTTLMALVVPDHEVARLLDSEEMMEQRQELREKRSKQAKPQPHATVDYNPEEKPFTRGDFESALKKVSRKIQPSRSDEGKSKT